LSADLSTSEFRASETSTFGIASALSDDPHLYRVNDFFSGRNEPDDDNGAA